MCKTNKGRYSKPLKAFFSPQLKQSHHMHFSLPQLFILKQNSFRRLFSEKPSRRSAYFCGSFLQHHSNQFSFVFSANWISKIILDYSVHTCKVQNISGVLPVCACSESTAVQLCVQVWCWFILQCFAHESPSRNVSKCTFKCRHAPQTDLVCEALAGSTFKV